MARVKVWNLNSHPHKEMFKGSLIEIEAGGHVEMDYEDAVQFRGQFTGIAPKMANGEPDPRFFKKIKVERPVEPAFKEDPLRDVATGKTFATREDMAAMLSSMRHMQAVDPDADKAAAASSRGELDDLKATIARQQAQIDQLLNPPKRGPGRPRKEAAG